MSKNLVKNVWQILLTAAQPEQELDLSVQELTTGTREVVLGGSLDSGAYVKIQRWIDDFTGYQDELNIALTPKSVFKLDVIGAGYGFATYHRAGKIKFVLVNGGSSQAKLSILK